MRRIKTLVFALTIFAVCVHTYATRPFAPAIFSDGGDAFVVGFAWPDQNGNVLIIRTMRETASFSLDELGIAPFEGFSTAGYQWYQNAIGYVVTLNVKNGEDTSLVRMFYFRHRDGKEAAIELSAMQPFDLSRITERDELDRKTVSQADKLLRSPNPRDRQTAAIHLGDLRSQQHLQDMIKLLEDRSSSTRGSGGRAETVYFVRDAAKEAIRLIRGSESAN